MRDLYVTVTPTESTMDRHELHDRLVEITRGHTADVPTPFGDVTMCGRDLSIFATEDQLSAWARRPGAEWPCSSLVRQTYGGGTVRASLFRGDIVDVEPATRDIDGDEFDAWCVAVLTAARAGILASMAVQIATTTRPGTEARIAARRTHGDTLALRIAIDAVDRKRYDPAALRRATLAEMRGCTR